MDYKEDNNKSTRLHFVQSSFDKLNQKISTTSIQRDDYFDHFSLLRSKIRSKIIENAK